MVVGRRFTPSSISRFYIKMYARQTPFVVPPNIRNMENAVNVDFYPAKLSAYNITVNWVNAVLPYSELKYKVVAIAERHGIPRGNSYVFMACAQHLYKMVVLKHDANPEETFDRCYNIIFGSGEQQDFWGPKTDEALQTLADIFALLGFPGVVSGAVGTAESTQ